MEKCLCRAGLISPRNTLVMQSEFSWVKNLVFDVEIIDTNIYGTCNATIKESLFPNRNSLKRVIQNLSKSTFGGRILF